MSRHDQPLGLSDVILNTLAGTVFLSVSILLGTGLFSVCSKAIRLQNAVLVDARVLNIDRRFVHKGDGSGEEVTVKYEYHYAGNRHKQSSQQLSLFGSDHTIVEELEEAFAAGNTVQCFVDPDEPSLSVFSKEFVLGNFLLYLAIVAAFSGVSVIIIVEFYRRASKTLLLKKQARGESK
jgi:hypothetical protein